MLIPIRHEQMSARRWPVVTLTLIALNTVIFLLTHWSVSDEPSRSSVDRLHILYLAALHPELKFPPQAQQVVDDYRAAEPQSWKWAVDQGFNRRAADAWDAQIRTLNDNALQEEMDRLVADYAQASASPGFYEEYAFIPAHPSLVSYLTANFLHGGWLHLIGNMWFLWLAGFVLEDVWGRVLYTAFYLVAGAVALQFHAWTNLHSHVATLGASGAVAALMGAFVVRFPKMQITMVWLRFLRFHTFQAAAYWLLPLWVLMEIFYGALVGTSGGVAHWAHVGGFLFGVAGAVAFRYSGLEQKANKSVEAKIDKEVMTNDPEIVHAADLIENGQTDEAIATLQTYLEAKPDSLDGWTLLQQTYCGKHDWPKYHEATVKLCNALIKARDLDGAWQLYEEFLNSSGDVALLPASTWYDLCRAAENRKDFERALTEYQNLAAAHPSQRQALLALIAAGRICLKQLNRPEEALRYYQEAAASPIPHLDWEQAIAAGIREAQAGLSPAGPPHSVTKVAAGS
ncbi:MAG TPA: rhomboid family intramembrane serine protease [Candidatus Angelobacter sp.]|nr:rhomboid family intramembrane serine protease [Candidatus Angelobacter sp.]